MTEDMLKELFDKIVNILENDSGEERRINIKKIWNGLSENDCNLFADYLKKIPYKRIRKPWCRSILHIPFFTLSLLSRGEIKYEILQTLT